jgi:hypothetical protein
LIQIKRSGRIALLNPTAAYQHLAGNSRGDGMKRLVKFVLAAAIGLTPLEEVHAVGGAAPNGKEVACDSVT